MSNYPYQGRDVEAGPPPGYPHSQYQPPQHYPTQDGYQPPPPQQYSQQLPSQYPQQYPPQYPPTAPSYNSTDALYNSDNDSDRYSNAGITDFSDRSVRQGFIRK